MWHIRLYRWKGAGKHMGKSGRNIMDFKTGFNVRANLYIIRYLYYHMNKANKFMMEGKGKRRKSVGIEKYVPISRTRFKRIFDDENFEISSEDKKTISECFNINEEYFKKDGELIPIHELTQEDWKCFFSMQYNDGKIKLTKTRTEIEAGTEKVEGSLKKLTKKNHVANNYSTKTAVYRIHYFFENGAVFKEESALNLFLESLELLKISDWEELEKNPESMRKYVGLLEKHYEYASACVKCWDMRKMG